MANTTSNLVSIKEAIAWAHDEMHNRRALGKDDFAELGLTENAYNNWVAYVTELRKAVVDYNTVAQAEDAVKAFKSLGIKTKSEPDEKKALATVEGAVWSAWRAVLKAGTEKDFNKNFFVRKADITMIAGFCGLGKVNTARGPQLGTKALTDFRKNIEMCIGVRMTGNGLLSDEKKDLIVAYEGAIRAIQTNTDALNDSKDSKGKTVLGLVNSLEKEQNDLDNLNAMLDEMGATEEQRNKFTAAQQAKVDALSDSVDKAKKAIADAEKVRDEKKEEYDKTIALLNSVGDFK